MFRDGYRQHGRHDLDLEVAEIRRRLAAANATVAEPSVQRPWQAATALIVAPGDAGADIAFIRRSERDGDPWSGHMALPGGRRDAADADLATTARRETLEEIGVELDGHDARLPDQTGRTSRGLIAAFVHVLDHRPALRPDPREVAEALWIPLGKLVEPAATVKVKWTGIPLPAIDHDGRIIWGLTHRILTSFLDALHVTHPG
jgi:8-oxo-dGTP pyrophosphatase MutT (NUDIX family)